MIKLFSRIFVLLLLASPSWGKTVLVLGDSLSAGYGISVEEGWVNLLQQSLNDAKSNEHKIVNASVTGETTGGGLARLPALLAKHQPDIVIVELGGNDGLRGHAIKVMRKNILGIVQLSRDAGAETLLLGMQIPPNYGRRYTQQFANAYGKIAQTESLRLVPFFLDKVALTKGWMQADGIHPNEKAQAQLLANVLPYLRPIL